MNVWRRATVMTWSPVILTRFTTTKTGRALRKLTVPPLGQAPGCSAYPGGIEARIGYRVRQGVRMRLLNRMYSWCTSAIR